VRVFSSHVPIDLVPTWWMPVSGLTDVYDLIISFRDQSYMCSGKMSSLVLGDRLVINNYYRMPETGRAASGLNWNAGACIPEMGIHYSYDVSTNGPMSWNASTLLPVMPMFGVNDDQIKAVLIATPTFQTVEPFGEFEGPFINPLMCLNWCEDTGCTFAGTTFWTTMHWLFTDYHDVSCTGAKCSV